jgi:hypothetical protein
MHQQTRLCQEVVLFLPFQSKEAKKSQVTLMVKNASQFFMMRFIHRNLNQRFRIFHLISAFCFIQLSSQSSYLGFRFSSFQLV